LVGPDGHEHELLIVGAAEDDLVAVAVGEIAEALGAFAGEGGDFDGMVGAI